MERLTEWIDDGEEKRAIPRTDLRNCGHERCTTQLAKYEDTGLIPEEIEYLRRDYEKRVCTGCWLKDEKEIARQIQALKTRYQEGMNVHYQGDDESDGIECPMCGYEVARNDDFSEMRPKHCPGCGTRLIY